MTHTHTLLKLEEANEKVKLLVKVFGLQADTQAKDLSFEDTQTPAKQTTAAKQLTMFE